MISEDVRNWIKKADNDLKISEKDIESAEPLTDIISFHCQQCVEKYLKAFLVHHNKEFRKTHDLAELIKLCEVVDPDFKKLFGIKVDVLTSYAIELRYPDYFYIPTIVEAKEAVEKAREVKNFIREKLNYYE